MFYIYPTLKGDYKIPKGMHGNLSVMGGKH